MHIDRRLVGFGLFLIAIGGVMVAVRQGVIAEDTARQAWTIWPLILIGSGLSIVLAGRPGAAIGGLVVAVTFGVILGGLAATGVFPGAGICAGHGSDGRPFQDAAGDLGTSGRVSVTQDCGDLAIGTVGGTTWSVSGTSRDGTPPRIDRGDGRLRFRSPDGGPFDFGGGSAWNVVLPRDPSINLDVEVNGGESRITLGGAHLGSLSIGANAGSVDLDLRDVAAIGDATIDVNFGSATIHLPSRSFTTELEVNAGSAAICLPAGTGLRVKIDSVAASNDFADHGLIQVGGAWETPGYATAETRVDIRADVNAGSLTVDPARQCAG